MELHSRMARWATAAALVALIVGLSPPSALAGTRARARAGVGFLASQQQPNGSIPAFSPVGSTADAVLAMVSAGHGRRQVRRAMGFLERKVVHGRARSVGLKAKVTLAAVAAGEDPRSFGGVNLVRAIRTTEGTDGRLGASTPVFEDALGILALEAAGATVSRRALTWLASAQCPDGGWQYDEPYGPTTDDQHCLDQTSPGSDYFQSDTNTSGIAVQALNGPAGRPAPSLGAHPFGFFTAIRDSAFGGWGYSWGVQTTDANSTALVIQAYVSAGKRLPSGAMRALKALQYPLCGAWAYTWIGDPGSATRTPPDVGATIGAIPAALLAAMPIFPGGPLGPAPDAPPCPS